MILVDIGNSGVRAARVADSFCALDIASTSSTMAARALPVETVYRLSWAATGTPHRKPSPEQLAAPNQRWCNLDDSAAFDWLVQHLCDPSVLSNSSEAWWISSVQRRALDQLTSSLKQLNPAASVHTISYRDVPMAVCVDAPQRLGIDRLCAAYAAWTITRERRQLPDNAEPLIVVQAGTAVAVDLVSASGEFLGGAIMPGLGLSLQLLAAGTDQLPWLANHTVASEPVVPGKNTEQAISAGVSAALIGGASHLIHRYRDQCGNAQIQAIVSGGDGDLLARHLPAPVEFIDQLVLCGLHRIAISNGTRTSNIGPQDRK